MPTTSASISLSSSDLTTSALSIAAETRLKKAGETSLGLTDTSGLARKTTTASSIFTLLYADDYTADGAHKVYLKNMSTIASEYFTLTVDDEEIGRLYAGDFAFFPWSAKDGTKEVFTATCDGTWQVADNLTFDGVQVNAGASASATAAILRATIYPNWVVTGSGDDAIFTAKRARADQEIDTTEFVLVDAASSDATFTIATTTNGLDDAADIKITPSVATSMTLEYMLINE